jgi:hypothetical protein
VSEAALMVKLSLDLLRSPVAGTTSSVNPRFGLVDGFKAEFGLVGLIIRQKRAALLCGQHAGCREPGRLLPGLHGFPRARAKGTVDGPVINTVPGHRLLQRIFGQLEIAQTPDQRRHQPPAILPHHRIKGAGGGKGAGGKISHHHPWLAGV